MGNLFSLKDKTVCVIGGTGLIGNALVDGFLDVEADIFVGARKTEGNKLPYTVLPIDISDEKSIDNFINQVLSVNDKIDVWINCAFPHFNYSDVELESIKSEEMLKEMNGHLLGFFNCCRRMLNIMKKQGKGSIVNFGSIYGDMVPDFKIYENTEIKKIPTYFIIKSGIHMMTKYFAAQGAEYGVRFNTVAPGGVYDNHSRTFEANYSNRTPMKRMAKPEDCIGATVFLACDASSYVTGQTLFVDGGLSIY